MTTTRIFCWDWKQEEPTDKIEKARKRIRFAKTYTVDFDSDMHIKAISNGSFSDIRADVLAEFAIEEDGEFFMDIIEDGEEESKPTLVEYAGEVSWFNERLQKRFCKGVTVKGPVQWDPSFYGSGVELFQAIEAKARKRWPNARCNEAWRI